MVVKKNYEKDIFGRNNPGVNISYYGKEDIEKSNISEHIKKDAINFFGRDCISNGKL